MKFHIFLILTLICPSVFASDVLINLKATNSVSGYAVLIIFALAYFFVMIEERTHFRKSKPVVLSAGAIWIIIALLCKSKGLPDAAYQAAKSTFLEFAELFLFILVAMTYINVLDNRNVFKTLRVWLINKGLSYRQCFWVTGFLAFFISPVADNLTTALIMCAVVMAIGIDSPKFICNYSAIKSNIFSKNA